MTPEEVIALYKEHGTIEAVLEHADLPRSEVAEIVASLPDREAYRRRGNHGYSQAELIGHLHIAKSNLGEPLGRLAYRDFASGAGLASDITQAKHFGSWPLALRAAEIEGNPSTGRAYSSLTPDECLQALSECIIDNGGKWVSVRTYEAWAKGRDVASAASIRNIIGRWSDAVQQAMERLAIV